MSFIFCTIYKSFALKICQWLIIGDVALTDFESYSQCIASGLTDDEWSGHCFPFLSKTEKICNLPNCVRLKGQLSCLKSFYADWKLGTLSSKTLSSNLAQKTLCLTQGPNPLKEASQTIPVHMRCIYL